MERHRFITGDPAEFVQAAHQGSTDMRRAKAERAILAEHEIRDGRCRVCAARAGDGWQRFVAPCPTVCHLAEGWGWEWIEVDYAEEHRQRKAAQNGDL